MAVRDDLLNDAPDRATAQKVLAAIDALFKGDAVLFAVDVNERTISHRLAYHMTPEFPDWDVDCEYNRKGCVPKRLLLGRGAVEAADTDGSRVFPDIIVHHRATTDNLLVIEVKKSTSNVADDDDLAKLIAFRDDLGYRFGLFLRFASNTKTPAIVTASWTDLIGEP